MGGQDMGAENTQPRFEEEGASDAPELQVIPFRARASLRQTPKVTAAGNCFPNGRRELGKEGGRRVAGVGSEVGTKSVK